MKFDLTITSLEILTLAGIVVTLIIFMVTYASGRRQDRHLAHRQIYQRLELASIEVFQNQIEHPELAQIWEVNRTEMRSRKGALPVDSYDAFLYQQLNLFEMAYRFCKDDLMPTDVFGSWVIWFGDLCSSPYFREFWIGEDAVAPLNYVPDFRKIMTEGCMIYGGEKLNLQEKRETFFTFVGEELQSETISQWLRRT